MARLTVSISHNHPSGDPEASDEDNHFTKTVKEAGRLIGIDMVDHVIAGKGRFYSYADHGLV